jgi:hypothetical protein
MPVLNPSQPTYGLGSTVGDMIFLTRSQIPDMPLVTLPVPAATVAVTSAPGSTLPLGTYCCVVTQRNPWGETLGSTEVTGLAVGPGQGIQITSALLPGASAIRAYLTLPGGAAGSEVQFQESSSSPFVISTQALGFGPPPTRNSAYQIDSDGPAFSSAIVYKWLNQALNKLSRAVGGLLDYCGVPTAAGQPLYVMPGEWLEVSDVWYGGYWVQGGKRGDFFRRNAVNTSILSGVSVSIFSNQQIIEVSYQPDRSSGITTSTAPMVPSDNLVNIVDPSQFLLPFGFAQLGTGPGSEFIAYASASNGQLSGLIRGIGGSAAQSWPSGTQVTELSLFWCGKRILPANLFSPGQAAAVLPVPQGWESIIPTYMLGQAKRSELDVDGGMKLEKQAIDEAKDWLMSNKGVVRQVQVNGYSQQRPGIFAPTPAGGVIIPGP